MNHEDQTTVNVIKRASGAAGYRGVIKNQTLAAKRDAEDIIARARQEAEAVREQALKDAERAVDEAYREGTQKALAEFETMLAEIAEIRSKVFRNVESDVLVLSVRIAEKILGEELTFNPKAISDIVSTALRNARQREKVTVFVNPSDLGTVTTEAEKFSSNERIRMLDFVADPSVPAGGCVIETEVGKIDARLETQLEVIESALLSQSDGGETI